MLTKRLRIGFATPEFVTENHFDGGLANYLNRVSQKLAELNHDVNVITLSLKDETEFEHDGVMVHRVRLRPSWQLANRITRYSLSTTLHWLNFSAQTYRKLKQLHRRQPFDIIQFPNYSSCGIFTIPLLRGTHVIRASSYQPVLNEAAGLKSNLDSALTEWLEALQYKLCSNVIAPSRTMQEILAAKANVRGARLIRTPFFVETKQLDTSVYDQLLTGKKYALYFGRFQLPKGIHVLARALPRFLNECPDAHVVLVGRDMETNLAASMAGFVRAQCGSQATRVVLLDNLQHSQLYPVISGAQFVVLPSLIDNSPNTCLEAMGLGKVVIGTTGASFDELITDGVNGFLVPAGNSEALSEKMIAAWTDPRLPAMGTSARQQIAEFSPEKTVTSLLSYYEELLK